MGITKELRRHVAQMKDSCAVSSEEASTLIKIADAIDAEHKRRMERSGVDIRTATCKYFHKVIYDYGRGIKRMARRAATSCIDDCGRRYCSQCYAELVLGQMYCGTCGAKIKNNEVA